MLTGLKKLWQDEAGATTVDYAILMAMLVLAGAFAYQKLGSAVSETVGQASEELAGGREGIWRQAAAAARLP